MSGQSKVLRADCSNCFGLCCVVPAFAKSSDFAIGKPAETPCPNLADDFRCGIHSRLRDKGFAGCTVYDCFGAGQQVSQVTFHGQDWRTAPSSMFSVFPIMRALHEMLWYLREGQTLASSQLQPELARSCAYLEQLAEAGPEELLAADTDHIRARVAGLLRTVSAQARAGRRPPPDHANATLIGADLAGADLRRADLRGALLVGARLDRADLRLADLIGADLRGAGLSGADLTGALFVTQAQIDAARGDAATRLPAHRDRPLHWPGTGPDG